MDGTGARRVGARRSVIGAIATVSLVLTACGGGSGDSASSSTAPSTVAAAYSLTRQWELGSAPITRSLFVRRGTVIAAGERTRGIPSSEAVTAIDATTGTLRWSHPLRETASDPQAIAFEGQTLRIIAAEDGVYVSSYGSGGIKNPIVGYAVGTGVRLFPSAEKLDENESVEEVVGADDAGLVTSAGVLRDPATGVVRRYKFVGGSVLAIAGPLAFSWDGIDGSLTAYDLATDRPRWTVPMPIRPTVVVVDTDTILLVSSDGWRRLDLTSGATEPMEFQGVVDPLSSFDTCSSSDFQSVPVGRYASPIACDDTYVAASLGDRLEIYDLSTDASVRVAVCDPDSDPFALAGGLFACATTGPDGRLSIRLVDASSGFQVLDFSDDRAGPVGLVLTEDQLIVSLEDGSIVAYALTR